MNAFKNDKLVLTGIKNKQDGLWDVSFHQNKMNFIIHRDKSKIELTKYLHGCVFSPKISTFQNSINKENFITWPGIDTIKFKNHSVHH